MWKLVIGFIVFAGLALYLLMKGGDIDMGGEKHGEPIHVEAPAPAASTVAPAVVAPASAAAPASASK